MFLIGPLNQSSCHPHRDVVCWKEGSSLPWHCLCHFVSVNDLLSSFLGKGRELLISSLDGIAHKVTSSTPKLKLNCLKSNVFDQMWKRCLINLSDCLRALVCEAPTAISDPMAASNTVLWWKIAFPDISYFLQLKAEVDKWWPGAYPVFLPNLRQTISLSPSNGEAQRNWAQFNF